jgi:hypothetical protein
MSMMGELTFCLGIQVKQTKEGIFVHQAKYMMDLIKKFAMVDAKPVSTPMSVMTALDPDDNMIGSLLYLTAIRPDVQFTVCLCACF